jgi:hypothetical protein
MQLQAIHDVDATEPTRPPENLKKQRSCRIATSPFDTLPRYDQFFSRKWGIQTKTHCQV